MTKGAFLHAGEDVEAQSQLTLANDSKLHVFGVCGALRPVICTQLQRVFFKRQNMICHQNISKECSSKPLVNATLSKYPCFSFGTPDTPTSSHIHKPLP